jgi:hypothetical protein
VERFQQKFSTGFLQINAGQMCDPEQEDSKRVVPAG